MFPESELAIHRATHSTTIVHPEPDLPDLGALCSGQRHQGALEMQVPGIFTLKSAINSNRIYGEQI